MDELSRLQPSAVWRHFSNLCRIPRASGRESVVRGAISEWAAGRGLGVRTDSFGNLVLSKAATAGYENRPGVVLQGHLDMVCQKHGNSTHDFDRDPILPVLRDGWVTALDTTLGADNGIGVALALAALESDTLAHPKLEVLLTLDEEAGMHGAINLAPDAVQGRLLLNLDTEEWGELYIGCAGSTDMIADIALPTEATPAGWQTITLCLTGLAGGHSGIDIHRHRGNAIKLLVWFLRELADKGFDFQMASMSGGTAHNAIPREAEVTLALPDASHLQEEAESFVGRYRDTLNEEDAKVRFDFVLPQRAPKSVLPVEIAYKVLTLLDKLPYGVRRMSKSMPEVVETSNNVGEISLNNGHLHANMMVRSLNEAGIRELSDEIVTLFTEAGFSGIQMNDAGPVWEPKPDSTLLALARDVYRQTFNSEAKIQLIHAGLECGVFSRLWPDMDMISFGPTIRGAHSPNERVEVASVERAWKLLAGILAAVS
ncbi:MAG: beta-Ala-His dipeptidase [Azoarcus sp.]|jgi:dipeptidase D|nr:beta-Ala-His dipeptidase [Azoarcus sp.]